MSVLVINIIVNLQMKTLRVIGQTRYEDRGYSNEESIAYLQLQKPEEINSFLTYNYGMDDDRFPLSFITEGQGSRGRPSKR